NIFGDKSLTPYNLLRSTQIRSENSIAVIFEAKNNFAKSIIAILFIVHLSLNKFDHYPHLDLFSTQIRTHHLIFFFDLIITTFIVLGLK
ncbi:hypothetical protein L082_27019, partial [Escherichia coli SHECO001]